jgi:hypothetical protein
MRRLRRHRFSPVRFVSAYDATGRGARQTMMNSEVTRGSTNDGPLDASFRLCRNGCKRQSEADCSNTEHGSHARHNGTSRYLPYLNSGNLAWFHKFLALSWIGVRAAGTGAQPDTGGAMDHARAHPINEKQDQQLSSLPKRRPSAFAADATV